MHCHSKQRIGAVMPLDSYQALSGTADQVAGRARLLPPPPQALAGLAGCTTRCGGQAGVEVRTHVAQSSTRETKHTNEQRCHAQCTTHLRLFTRCSGRPLGGSRSGAVSAGAACPAGAVCSRLPRSCGLRLAPAKGLGPSSDMLPVLLRLLRLPGLAGSSKHTSSCAPPLPAARLRLPPAGGPRWDASQGSTAGACSSSGAPRSLPPPP